MNHPVIPTPVEIGHQAEGFRLRSGTKVGYRAAEVTSIVDRFCADVARRVGVSLVPLTEFADSVDPMVRIELPASSAFAGLSSTQGVTPSGAGPADERYSLTIDIDQILVRAVEPIGVARGLTTLLQLVITAGSAAQDGVVPIPGLRVTDGPRYAWRGLSLDVARTFFTVDEVRRVVDLLALYKLNVLHLHLTDDQGWRLPIGRSDSVPAGDMTFYAAEDLRALVHYAADRFVTIVPEVDTPGHASALVQLNPQLNSSRNQVEFELPPGRKHHTVWLDPELPATFEVIEEVLSGVAAIFPSLYVHIGGDEPHGMPHELYAAYVNRVRDHVRSLGKRPLGWQESARAGLTRLDMIQYWFTNIGLPDSLPDEVRAQMDAALARSRRDLETAVRTGVPVIMSPLSNCYLDVPYAEAPAHPAQAERHHRVGLRFYSPMTVEQSYRWEPADALDPSHAAQVAGVEAAIWAETIRDFDDLSFLLLPRLAGVAEKAWAPAHATP